MNNEELFYLLQKFYPGTINGTHYLTGHCLDESGNQVGEAFISNWTLPTPEPDAAQLKNLWLDNMVEIRSTVKGVRVRWDRNNRLLDADAMVGRAEDSGDAELAAACRRYRQALRDVPQQPGFPDSFEWPVAPAA